MLEKIIIMAIFIFLWISFLANNNSMNLALGRPCGCEESDAESPDMHCYDLYFLGIYVDEGSYHYLTSVTIVQLPGFT